MNAALCHCSSWQGEMELGVGVEGVGVAPGGEDRVL